MRAACLLLVVACSDPVTPACPGEDVECGPDPGEFRLGGVVSNLEGTLVLGNADLDQVTVTADGEFVFPLLLGSSSAYVVAVAAQPAGQTCVVANGVGTIELEHVMDIVVTCGPTSAATIRCSANTACPKATQFCCFDGDLGSGTCADEGAACASERVECDSVDDCGADAVCCATYADRELIGATCVTSSQCSDEPEFELWCDPAADDACPDGRSCTGTSSTSGFAICE